MRIISIIIGLVIISSCNQLAKKEQDSTLVLKDSTTNKIVVSNDKPALDTVEIINSPYTDSVYLKIEIQEKDWWENIYLVQNDTELVIPISSQSILDAKFIDLKFKNKIFFEIYEVTNQGNGFYNLFEYHNGELKNILESRAVDFGQEGLGIRQDSSFIIKDDKLKSDYFDLNKDGYLDVKLSGAGYVLIGDNDEKNNLKDSIEMERQFIWNNKSQKFQELIKKRKGFWYYDKYGIPY